MRKFIAVAVEPDNISVSPWFSISRGLFQSRATPVGVDESPQLDTDLIWDLDTVMSLFIKAVRNSPSTIGFSGIWIYNNVINIIGTKEYIDDLIRYNSKIQKLTRNNSDLTIKINETHSMIMIPEHFLDTESLLQCQQLFRHVTRELKVYHDLSQNQIAEAKINRLLYGEVGLIASALSSISIFYDKKYLDVILAKTNLDYLPWMDSVKNVAQNIEDPMWNAYFTINIFKRIYDLVRTGRLTTTEIQERLPKDIAKPLIKWLTNRRLFNKILIANNLISLGSAFVPLGSFFSSAKLITLSLVYRGFDQLYINYWRQLKKGQVETLVNHESIYAWIRSVEADLKNITDVNKSTASPEVKMTHFMIATLQEEARYFQNQRSALAAERTELNQFLADPAYSQHPLHELILKNRLTQIEAFDNEFHKQLAHVEYRLNAIMNPSKPHVPKSQTAEMIQAVIAFLDEEYLEEEVIAKLVLKPSLYVETHPDQPDQRRFDYQLLAEDIESTDPEIQKQAKATLNALYSATLQAITQTVYEQRINLERELMALEYEQIVIEKEIANHDNQPLYIQGLQAAFDAKTPPDVYWKNCLRELNFMNPN